MKSANEHEGANELKWNGKSDAFDKWRHFYFRVIQGITVRISGLVPDMSFLDIGCGTGWAVFFAARCINEKGRFYGVDISQGMIRRARERIKGRKNISFHKASAEELPLPDNSINRIICTNSFHHYLNPLSALKEAYRVTAPFGKIFIVDVAANDFFVRWIDGIVSRREKEHVRFHSSSEMRKLFAGAGFENGRSRMFAYPLRIHIADK